MVDTLFKFEDSLLFKTSPMIFLEFPRRNYLANVNLYE